MNLKYFTLSEFDSPDQKGSGSLMDRNLLLQLDTIRENYGRPIRITSGYRTAEHNAKVGGVEFSSHTKGRAVDIACTSSQERHDLLKHIFAAGIHRVGIANTFIHIDNDPDKPAGCVWTY